MDIPALRLFDQVVSLGSFAAAARASGADPSAVSRSIAGLERELGFRLFQRSTRRIALTEAGTAYHNRIAPLLKDLDDAADAARDLVERPSGTLVVATSTAFGEIVILPMLPAFREAHPGLGIDLRLSDAPADLIAEGIDLAIRLTRDAPADTIAARLISTRYHVVASPDWVARNPMAHPSDLKSADCLVFPYPGFRDRWQFNAPGQAPVSVGIQSSLRITGALAMAAAARLGLGPALLADWLIARDLADGQLVDLFPGWTAAAGEDTTAAYLLYPSRAYLPLKTRVFIDALQSHLPSGKAKRSV